MNYILQINRFWELERDLAGVDAHLQSYYFAMLFFANKYGFEFTLYREDVMEQAKLAKNTYYKVRQQAKELGLVDFTEGESKRTKCSFKVIELSQNCDKKKDKKKDKACDIPKDIPCDKACDHTDKLINLQTNKLINNKKNKQKNLDSSEIDFSKVDFKNLESATQDLKEKSEEPKVIPLSTHEKEKEKNSGQKEKEFSEVEILEEFPFEDFWLLYDKKVDKPDCIRIWKTIKDREKEHIMQNHLPAYVQVTPKQFRKDPKRYLNHRAWENEIIMPENNKNNGRGQTKFSQEGLAAAAYKMWGKTGN